MMACMMRQADACVRAFSFAGARPLRHPPGRVPQMALRSTSTAIVVGRPLLAPASAELLTLDSSRRASGKGQEATALAFRQTVRHYVRTPTEPRWTPNGGRRRVPSQTTGSTIGSGSAASLLRGCEAACTPSSARAWPVVDALSMACFFSTAASAPPADQKPPAASTQPMPEAAFHALADATLNSIENAVGAALEDLVEGFDGSHAMGVLTLWLGSKGTFVLNKQTPNRQLWWSSPLSGPRRYVWDARTRRWINTRDGHELMAALAQELYELTKVEVYLDPDAAASTAR